MIPISYCRHCGGRVASAKRDKCVYCGLGLTREPETKVCPFCSESIRSNAVKCRFCGEFVDGRERAVKEEKPVPSGPSNVQIFVIDKALVNTSQDMMIEGGQPLPPALAQRLPNQARQAIEANRPDLLPAGQVRALPAPHSADPGLVDVEAQMPDAAHGPGEGARGAQTIAALEAPVEPWKTRAPKIAGRASLWTMKKLGAAAWAGLKWGARKTGEIWMALLARRAAARQAAQQAAEDAEKEQAQGQCPGCGVAVHPLDLFCFNCGKRIGQGPTPFEASAPPMADAGVSLWVRLALVLGIFGWVPVPVPACQVRIPVAIVGLLCGIVALLRIGRSRGRVKGRAAAIAGIALALVWLAMIPLMKRGQVRVPVVEKFWQTVEPAPGPAPEAAD